MADIERLCGMRTAWRAHLRHAQHHPARRRAGSRRRLAWDLYHAGVDALIVQDMGLLELDLPPIQLHASTQTDIRTPEKARFLQDVGFSQMVLARELSLQQIRAIPPGAACGAGVLHPRRAVRGLQRPVHISHAHTGRSANRGSCSQECRLPYTVTDAQGRIVAHDKHVLSLKDNNQSANLRALVDAGIRSFKIEGRYKDMATVKNVTAHYRLLLDALLEGRPDLQASSSDGHCTSPSRPTPTAASTAAAPTTSSTAARSTSAPSTRPSTPAAGGPRARVGADHFDCRRADGADTLLNNGDA
jgi:23S rRNA 5-hydroxycytidine C2501 synthase